MSGIRSFFRCRSRPVSVLTGLLLWALSTAVPALPRVASMNLCTDQLLLLLAEPEQIVSLSHLAVEQGGSFFADEARQYRRNKGRTEEFLRLTPDAILAAGYTPAHSVALLRQLGLRVDVVNDPTTIEGIFQVLRQVGSVLEQQERAQSIIEHMQQRLAAIPRLPQLQPVAAIYDPNGYTVGSDSLRGQLLAFAGWRNLADEVGIRQYGTLSLETLVAEQPDAYVDSPYTLSAWSRAHQMTRHPALAGKQQAMRIAIPSAMTICAGPWTVDVIEMLYDARLQLLHRAEP